MNETQYQIYFTGNNDDDPEEMLLSSINGGNRFNDEYLGSAFTHILAIEQIKTFGTICNGIFTVRAVWTDNHGRQCTEVRGQYDREGRAL